MAEVLLKNQISGWLKAQSLWLKFIGKAIMEGSINDAEIQYAYKLFLYENKLGDWEGDLPKIDFIEVEEADNTGTAPLKFLKLSDVKNVNALTENQELNFSPNITIVYGGNGSGKSSYTRLLNNAFVSRGDKDIFKNVFNPQTGNPSCTFTFQGSGPLINICFPEHKADSSFSKFSVFDSKSIRTHLESENPLNFTPSGFDFFESLVNVYGKLIELLAQDIRSAKISNEFIAMFNNDNQVRDFIVALGAGSKEIDLNKLAKYGEEEKGQLSDLIVKRDELKAMNIAEKIKSLQGNIDKLNSLKKSFNLIQLFFSEEKLVEIASILDKYVALQKLIAQEGIESLKEYEINDIGSPEWRKFIQAAKTYSEAIEKHNGQAYPMKEDNCLFCLQPLNDYNRKLIESYWTLLKSEAEKELKLLVDSINGHLKRVNDLAVFKFDVDNASFDIVKNIDVNISEKWNKLSYEYIEYKNKLIENLEIKRSKNEINAVSQTASDFDPIIENFSNELMQLVEQDTQLAIAKLDVDIALLNDRQILNAIQDKVTGYINSYKWAKSAERAGSAFKTNSITTKQGELFAEHVSAKYLEIFREECTDLDAPTFVNISQRNSKAATLRQLKIESSTANKILSEGEQRAISFADFITELRLNPNNTGIIFDDPTTSLDHDRRDKIALRFAKLALEKQVIVFTHDIVFMNKLRNDCEQLGLTPLVYTLRRVNDMVGIANPNLPWIAQTVSKRVKFLKSKLVEIKKIEDNGNEDDYLMAIKPWYELLREGWERAVEERLFKGVLERFSPAIQTQKLKGVVVTQELIEKIEKGMTESSAMIHDMSAAINSKPPSCAQAGNAIKELEDFISECQPA